SARIERHARRRRAVQGEWRRLPAGQRGEHALVGVGPDVVAAAEEEAASADPGLVASDLGLERVDHPDLTWRVDAAHGVAADGPLPGGFHGDVRDWDDTDPAVEFQRGVVLREERRAAESDTQHTRPHQ